MSNLSEKPIAELLGMNFFIPSYQRGYRWTERQVEDLLDDVWDFINKPNKKTNEWYCLQPVVVKFNKDHNRYEVLDGQQRLTTIFLILKHLERLIESERKNFEIEYETRNTESINSKVFLQDISLKTEKESIENIDYFHIFQVHRKIKEWFQIKANQGFSSISSKFITPFLENTKVIWYEVSAEKDAIEIFTRINMGKISLTNAELIKALFLNNSNFKGSDKEEIRLRQLEIASEWDRIEYTLQNDELWYFINNSENILPTRIEYIFQIMENISGAKNKNNRDSTSIFRFFSEKFKTKSKNEIDTNWKEIKRIFQTIEEWFNDRELYHKIGYLIATNIEIKELLKEAEGKKKNEFKNFLDIEIKKKNNVDLSNLEYNKGPVKNILLFHNIQTMLNFKQETSKFPFNRFKKENWDIEHIHAIATEVKVKKDEQIKWLKLNFIKTNNNNNNNNNEEFNKQIENIIIEEKLIDDNDFEKIISYVLGEEDNTIRNLCLLDRGTNRSYKNDSFKEKRRKIIENEKQGVFIPICTKNVFMKYYSKELKDLELWNEADRDSYFGDIESIIFLNQKSN